MDRISTTANYQSTLLNIMNASSAQNTAAQQVDTGKIGDSLESYAASADALTASQSLQARINTYVANGQNLSDKLTAQDQALSTVSTAAQGAQTAVKEALANGDATSLMTTLQSSFSEATSALNAQYNGQYLFSGTQVNTPPVDASSISDLVTNGVSASFKNDQNATVSRLNDTTTVTTGVLASNVGTPLFNALAQIQAYSNGPNGPLTGTLTTTQSTFLQGVLTSLGSAFTTANNAVAANGVVQDQVSASQTTLTAQQTQLTNTIGDITNADGAKAAANLQLAQTALSASAQVFAALNNSSLLSVLGVTTA
jgi:flagellar hook-associated protein 3 FlgL